MKVCIYVDARERFDFVKHLSHFLKDEDVKVSEKTLDLGDFAIVGITDNEERLFALFERKKWSDFEQSVVNSHLENQLTRMSDDKLSSVRMFLAIENGIASRVMSMRALNRTISNIIWCSDVEVQRTTGPEDTARLVSNLARSIARKGTTSMVKTMSGIRLDEFRSRAGKASGFTCHAEQQRAQLAAIKGVGPASAHAIACEYPTPRKLIAALDERGDDALALIRFGPKHRKLSKKVRENVASFYNSEETTKPGELTRPSKRRRRFYKPRTYV